MPSLLVPAGERLSTPVEAVVGTSAFAAVVSGLIYAEAGCRRKIRPIPLSRPGPTRVHWRERGRGPALVLINGWGASGLFWPREWLDKLTRSFRIILPDNRGTGWSRRALRPFTIADLADDVTTVLDEAGVDSAVVVGLSMGGMIAQELALRSPGRVDSLVLVATRPPAPAYRPSLEWALLWELLRPPCGEDAVEAAARRLWSMSAAPGFAERHPEVIDEVVRQQLERPTPRRVLLEQGRAVLGWGHSERLARIDVPTVVVHGSADPLIHADNGRIVSRLIPDADHVDLSGVGHLVPYEAPERLHAILVQATRTRRLAKAS